MIGSHVKILKRQDGWKNEWPMYVDGMEKYEGHEGEIIIRLQSDNPKAAYLIKFLDNKKYYFREDWFKKEEYLESELFEIC